MRATDHRAEGRPARPRLAVAIPLLLLFACAGAARREAGAPGAPPAGPPVCAAVPEGELAAPPAPACDDAALTGYDGLLVLAPHPDDEVLGFAGLTAAYLEQGKPVEVVVVTEGDAYCEACRFWSSGSVRGATCDAADLAEFARVRRGESTAAAALLGRPAPAFLGYPDTGLAAAWREARLGRPSTPLRRSDFGACADCESCAGGYGEGPVTELTAGTLAAALSARIAATSERTLLATTHPLDGHGDHAGLGNFVKSINDGFERPRPVAYAVIHAHTPKHAPAPDCWYPGPEAVACACPDERCAEADPGWIAALRAHRFRPEWPDAFPDDAPYGEPLHLCLPERMYRGPEAEKLRAVEAYRSQLGTLARNPGGAASGGRAAGAPGRDRRLQRLPDLVRALDRGLRALRSGRGAPACRYRGRRRLRPGRRVGRRRRRGRRRGRADREPPAADAGRRRRRLRGPAELAAARGRRELRADRRRAFRGLRPPPDGRCRELARHGLPRRRQPLRPPRGAGAGLLGPSPVAVRACA